MQTMKRSNYSRPITVFLLFGGIPTSWARFWVDLVRPEIYASTIVDPYRNVHEDESFLGASPSLSPPTEPPILVPTSSPVADIIDSPTMESDFPTQVPSLQPTHFQCGSGEYVHVLHMHDSWGDGWSGTTLKITEIQQEASSAESFVRGSSELFSFRVKEQDNVVFEGTLVDGFDEYEYLCLKPNACYDIHVEGGQWFDEIKWDIRNVTNFNDEKENDVKSGSSITSTVVKGLAPMACQFSMANQTGHRHCPLICESLTSIPTAFPSDAPSLSPSAASPNASPSHNNSTRIKNETDPEFSLQGDEEAEFPQISDVPSSAPSLDSAMGRHSQTNAPTLRHQSQAGWAKLEPTTLHPTSNGTVTEKRQDERPMETSSPTLTPTLFATYWTTFWSSTFYPSDLDEDSGNAFTPTISPAPSSTYYPTPAYSGAQLQKGRSATFSPTLTSSFGATIWSTTHSPTTAVTGTKNQALAQFVAGNNVATVHSDSVSTLSTATGPETSAPTPIQPTSSPDESAKHAFIVSTEAPVPSPSRSGVTWASIKEIQPTRSPVVVVSDTTETGRSSGGGSAMLTPVHIVPTPTSSMPSRAGVNNVARNREQPDTMLPSSFSIQAEIEEKSKFLNQVQALRKKIENDALQKLIEGREQARTNYTVQQKENDGSE